MDKHLYAMEHVCNRFPGSLCLHTIIVQHRITIVIHFQVFSNLPCTLSDSARIMVCGKIGEAAAHRTKRLNLFSYNGKFSITDDQGIAVSDYTMPLYADMVKHFTNPCDQVVFTSLCSGKVGSLIHFDCRAL